MPIFQELEPMMPSERALDRSGLLPLAETLLSEASSLDVDKASSSLHVFVEAENASYSNAIEGIRVSPEDVHWLLLSNTGFSTDATVREAQQACRGYGRVSHAVKHSTLWPETNSYVSEPIIKRIHQLLVTELPSSMQYVPSPRGGDPIAVVPGAYRKAGEDVIVGQHIAPSGERIPQLMARWEEAYCMDRLSPEKQVIAIMCAHHRLMWIHPFLDGNGRTVRLHTDLLFRKHGIEHCDYWSLSRGLFKNLDGYRCALANADAERQGSSDGRGGRSEVGLIRFCEFMIRTALEEIQARNEGR